MSAAGAIGGSPLAIATDHNNYPREAMVEAILRFVEEDLVQKEQRKLHDDM